MGTALKECGVRGLHIDGRRETFLVFPCSQAGGNTVSLHFLSHLNRLLAVAFAVVKSLQLQFREFIALLRQLFLCNAQIVSLPSNARDGFHSVEERDAERSIDIFAFVVSQLVVEPCSRVVQHLVVGSAHATANRDGGRQSPLGYTQVSAGDHDIILGRFQVRILRVFSGMSYPFILQSPCQQQGVGFRIVHQLFQSEQCCGKGVQLTCDFVVVAGELGFHLRHIRFALLANLCHDLSLAECQFTLQAFLLSHFHCALIIHHIAIGLEDLQGEFILLGPDLAVAHQQACFGGAKLVEPLETVEHGQ